MVAGKATSPSKSFQLEDAMDRWFMRTCKYINNYSGHSGSEYSSSTLSWSWSWSSVDNCGDLAAFDDEALVDEVEYSTPACQHERTLLKCYEMHQII
jgi:hypothetical protein